MYDATKPRDEQATTLAAGSYEVERIDNPLGFAQAPWIVLKGTKTGCTEASLRNWKNVVRAERASGRSQKHFDLRKYKVVLKG
jgi:hypothetical protein